MYYPPQQPAPYPPQSYGPRYSGCLKFLLYAVSAFIPLAGFIIAIIFMSKGDPEATGLGKTCLIIAIVMLVIGCCSSIVLGISTGFLSAFMEQMSY